MTTFYFIRHGKDDFTEANTKIYQGWGFNMRPLSPVGIEQIKNASKVERLQDADLIITSPYGRTMHTAAILSKELQLDMVVETDLHEWCADKNYEYLSDEAACKNYEELHKFNGIYPDGEEREWESAELIKKRIGNVLEKYKQYKKVIVVCHGTVMQYFLGVPHPNNGEIVEYVD